MFKNSRRQDEVESEARQRSEIQAAWRLHTTPQHEIRRAWLDRNMLRQRNRCSYCNVRMITYDGSGCYDRRATIDHVIARARDGADVEENTVAACAACNTAKSDMSKDEFLRHPVRLRRLREANTPPDRLAADPRSEFYHHDAITRGVGVRFRGRERDDVEEYCISEGWAKIRAGKAVDRRARPVTVKLSGVVEAYFEDL
jgi:5-methylcytosine-specific restriction endonuclease McrA